MKARVFLTRRMPDAVMARLAAEAALSAPGLRVIANFGAG